MDAFINTHHKDFRVKELAKFQNLTNPSKQGITYISTAAHFQLSKPIDECEIRDPITCLCENRTENLRQKI